MTPALNRYHEHLCVYLRAIDTRQKSHTAPVPKRDWFSWLGIDPDNPANPPSSHKEN